MSSSSASTEEKIVKHLEEKYKEEFELESKKEGSEIFANMYGGDKALVYPEGKPELVFLAGEDRDNKEEFYDTYLLSRWSNELDAKFKEQIESEFNDDIDYKFLLNIADKKYDASMKDLSFTEYVNEKNSDALVTLKIAIKVSEKPDLEKYSTAILNVYKALDALQVDMYGVSVGFVEETDILPDYMRTANYNNIPWTNLDAKVYGTIVFDNTRDIQTPEDVLDRYKDLEG
ncbi:hypothetical protein E1I69_11185 [Bacillus timonensis]|uniref:Uncharacterized protein n=1 Tax=Bacillus timonensis TaxID=1033734 RepID=A0A4S3PRT6_9BACI|nr:hypothetical protein [Bacillus timonensis]THE12421.1 hypothetical protein E1I69_11185 [Bacillus timonensis]